MFIGAHEAEYMFVTTLLKIEQHLLAQGRCPYRYLEKLAINESAITNLEDDWDGFTSGLEPY